MGSARVQREVAAQQVRTLFTLGTIDGMTDGRLLERFTTFADESAEAAFGALVERHGPMVLRVCRSVLHDRHDAEDAFQATFLVMVRRARSLWVRDSLGPWLYQVAHRTATRARTIENQRRRRERKAALGVVAEVEERPPDDLDEALHQEVARLPERYRAAVVLCLLEGLPNEQAARRLGWPVGTVQSRLARGRERLKRSLTRRGLAPSVAIAAASALPPKLAEATLQSALRYAATGSQAAAVSSSILVLTEGVLRMMMLAKLKTLVALAAVGGLGLATVAVPRSVGANGQEPASDQPPPAAAPNPSRNAEAPPKPEVFATARKESPDPDESTVRIQINNKDATATHVMGTIIKSTPAESIVLTCARITYRVGNETREILPWTQPDAIIVIYRVKSYRQTNNNPQEPSFQDAFLHGELIDSDVKRNVALVRFRPQEVLAASRIAPRSWKPEVGKPMLSIARFKDRSGQGNSEDPIIGVRKGLNLSPVYEAIECTPLPDQAFFGSGLFAKGLSGEGNLLAGVCNFQSPSASTGIYAAPAMIHHILDRNGLSDLYQADGPNVGPAPREDPPAAAPKPAEPPAAKEEAKAPAAEPKAIEEPKPVVAKAPFKYIPPPHISTVTIRIEREKPIVAAGTIIKSTPDETIVLTSARIFPPEAAKFQVKLTSEEKSRSNIQILSEIEAPGELIDRDLAHNVALIRVRSGHAHSASPIVPRNWKPRPGTNMTAMRGVSQDQPGQFVPCQILDVQKEEGGKAVYEAIHCNLLPKQTSEGSGLFTNGPYRESSFLAGVCNFGFPESKSGLYASPRMIYSILDRNGLSSLYEAEDPNLNSAPEPDFELQAVREPRGGFGPIAEPPAPEQPSPPPPTPETAPDAREAPGTDRLRKVEQRVDAIDGKLDEILRLLKKPD